MMDVLEKSYPWLGALIINHLTILSFHPGLLHLFHSSYERRFSLESTKYRRSKTAATVRSGARR